METIIDLEMEDYRYNEKILVQVAESFGKKIVEEIEYEMFADTGSIGKAAIVSEPKGVYRDTLVPENEIKGAWVTEAIHKADDGSPVFATYIKLDETKYFMFYSRE